MLVEGRIPLSEAEGEAIAQLEAQHGPVAGLTRRDPGETGPVLVTIGDQTYEVANG